MRLCTSYAKNNVIPRYSHNAQHQRISPYTSTAQRDRALCGLQHALMSDLRCGRKDLTDFLRELDSGHAFGKSELAEDADVADHRMTHPTAMERTSTNKFHRATPITQEMLGLDVFVFTARSLMLSAVLHGKHTQLHYGTNLNDLDLPITLISRSPNFLLL